MEADEIWFFFQQEYSNVYLSSCETIFRDCWGGIKEGWVLGHCILFHKKVELSFRDNPGPCSCAQLLSLVWLFATPCTSALQAPLSIEFSRQEYRSGLPFPIPGNLPNPEIKPTSPALAGKFFTTEPPGKPTLYSTVKHAKAQPLGEDALTWQCLPDTWTNVHEQMCKHTSTSLKVHNLKVPK